MANDTSGEIRRGPLQAGDRVPDFELTDGGQLYSSREMRRSGALLAVLFKTGCGTCKLAFPFIQRIHRLYAEPSGGGFQVIGISQDDAETTRNFAREYGGATFPIVLDSNLAVSRSFGITNVPNLYLLDSSDTIVDGVVGHFSIEGYNRIGALAARAAGVAYEAVVRTDDDVPEMKPG